MQKITTTKQVVKNMFWKWEEAKLERIQTFFTKIHATWLYDIIRLHKFRIFEERFTAFLVKIDEPKRQCKKDKEQKDRKKNRLIRQQAIAIANEDYKAAAAIRDKLKNL